MHQPREYEPQIQPKMNRERNIDPSMTIWSQYGKMISIVLLALIVVFLASYLFNQYNAEKLFGMQIHNEKVIKKMPAHLYVIEKEQPVRQVGDAFVYDRIGTIVGADMDVDRLNHENRYVPVLLTGNLGS